MRRALLVAALALVAAGPGCARIRFHRYSTPPPIESKLVGQYVTFFFATETVMPAIDISKYCPNGWQDISTETTGTQALLHFITLQNYSPWKYELTCLAPKEEKKDIF